MARNSIAMPKTDAARERQYRAQDALRTIKAHAQVTSDPALMRDVRTLVKQEMATLSKVAKSK